MDPHPPRKPSLVRAADLAQQPEDSFSHPFNPNSQVHGHSLGDATGMTRVGVHIIRVPPHKESFVYHSHHGEEEFIYILSGRAIGPSSSCTAARRSSAGPSACRPSAAVGPCSAASR